jgi:PAS domain S-box-containing protein
VTVPERRLVSPADHLAISDGALRVSAGVSAAGVATVLTVAGLGLWGALTHLTFLAGFIPGGATMKANTAILLIASALAVALGRHADSLGARLLGCLVVVVALATLAEDVFSVDLKIDQLVSIDRGRGPGMPGRMAPMAAIALSAIGGGLAFRDRARRLGVALTLVALLIASVALVGYLYDARSLYGVEPFASMSINTAMCLGVLAVTLLASRPQQPPVSLLTDTGMAGSLTRRLLPAVLIGPAVIGLLRLAGQRADFYGTEFGLALMVVGCTVFLVALVWINGRVVQRVETRRRGEEKFKALLESAPDAMIIVNASGHIVLVNTQMEHLFGYRRAEVLGQPIEMLIPPRFRGVHQSHRDGYVADPRVREMGTGQTLFARRRDGREFPVEVSLSPIETEEGRLVSAAVRDVTEHRAIQRTLHEKNLELEQAIYTKDRFLTSMSHELRTPLTAIIGFTGTLLMKLPGPLTDDQHEHLSIVQSSARHLLSLINDLLDLAKIESGKMEVSLQPVRCADVVDEVMATLAPLATAKHLSFDVENTCPDVMVRTDRRALSQILLNLTGNAIKFTERGSVRLGVATLDETAGRLLEINVMDTGIGIRPEEAARLFDAFSRLQETAGSPEGTGMGLHISRKLAALLGGELEYTSTPAAGSTFTLRLPLKD